MSAKEKIIALLETVCERKASDLHISVGSPPTFRIDGALKAGSDQAVSAEEATGLAEALLTDENLKKLNELGEVDFSYSIPASRFRINIYRQQGHCSIAVRAIARSVPTLEQLEMPAVIAPLADKPQGLILVTGPTGSGKSSTLAAFINHINRTQNKHIITLEDPIEYVHASASSIVEQREVGHDTRSFANGLRAALRQDPDVILVGEMRDLETISAAVTAAETGHLVLATLHTTDAPQTIDRIIDAFPGHQQAQIRSQLAAVLLTVISQRLLPRASGQGRIAATEILVNSPAVANLIRSEKVHQIRSVMQTGRALGMHTLDMSIKELLQKGIVTAAAARPYLTEGVN
ncbi:type IV pilus twitching motility protein PilT [Paenibacillus nanensis]|uniref:Type IV pilus twitching motility protein PilT n=1 Tax=Paenibacillus nanensis TaxID=393251 RepID=A0A3A1V3U7_9BACL|nr:type IV pilus twitching motility protein PilT [Paenibacillus nanensis]RIX54042.1 type IV pilus twitching motility protein PilT [Paenibacillus nanensis]